MLNPQPILMCLSNAQMHAAISRFDHLGLAEVVRAIHSVSQLPSSITRATPRSLSNTPRMLLE
jgi:hypothetical protein